MSLALHLRPQRDKARELARHRRVLALIVQRHLDGEADSRLHCESPTSFRRSHRYRCSRIWAVKFVWLPARRLILTRGDCALAAIVNVVPAPYRVLPIDDG